MQELGGRQSEYVTDASDDVGDQLVAISRHSSVVDDRPLERVGTLGGVEVTRLVVLVDGHRVRDDLIRNAAFNIGYSCVLFYIR